MAYELQAVIGRGDLLRVASRDISAARLASLGQGLALMPMTDKLFEDVADSDGDSMLGFWRLPGTFGRVLAEWSAAGPVAYVEAEYFGGFGEQRAAVWAHGEVALGPLHQPEGQPFLPAGSPISQALRQLGAVAGAQGDEFTAVGLHRHRETEDWIAPTPGRQSGLRNRRR